MARTQDDDVGTTTQVRRRWWALAVVCLAMFMGVLDSTSVYAALPQLTAGLGFAPAEAQWVVTAYGTAVGGLLILGGRLADHLGRRRVFLAAVALFAGASLAAGLAVSGEMLIAARVVQGAGAAVLTPAGLSILMDVFPDGAERNRALGIWGGLGGTGASAGLLLGGVLTDRAGWEWIFFTNVPVCALVLVLAPVLLPVGTRRHQRLDLPGAATATAALVLLLLALFRVAEHGPDVAAGALAVGAVLLGVVFVAIERRSPAPLVPVRIFGSRALVGGNVVVVTAGIAVDGMLILVTLFVQQVLGLSALQFGLVTAAMTVTSVVAVLAGQRLVTRSGFRVVAVGGLALLVPAFGLLSRQPADGGVAWLLVGMVVFGAGMGAAFVAGQIAALTGVAPDDAGLAAGVEETSFAVGTTVGAALASAVAVGHAAAGEPAATADGFAVALGVLAAVAAVGAVLAAVLLRAR